MHEVLVNRLGGLSLPRKSVVRLTDSPDMTLDVSRGRKTTMQQLNATPAFCSAMFLKGDNFLRLPVCLPGGQSRPKMGSTLKGQNLLQWEQILSFMR